jgi:hypothetical protein
MPKIFFDESGNTGEDLLNTDQQVFALASVLLDTNQAQELLGLLPPSQGAERKASRLLRSPRGRQALLALLRHGILNGTNCRVYLIDKLFMATTVLVDTFHYELTREMGHDMHSDGSAPSLAHCLHLTSPTFFGRHYYTELLSRFVKFMRKPSPQTLDDFYLQFDFLYTPLQIQYPETAELWIPVQMYRHRVLQQVPNFVGVGYNPVTTALFAMLHMWGKRLDRGFDVVFDDNPALRAEKDLVESVSDPSGPTFSTGYGIRSVDFPLKLNSLSFASSIGSPEIQVADLIAGLAREAFQQLMKPPEERDELFEVFEILGKGEMIDGVMAAYLDGVTEGAGLVLPGTNVAETMAAVLSRNNYATPPPRT